MNPVSSSSSAAAATYPPLEFCPATDSLGLLVAEIASKLNEAKFWKLIPQLLQLSKSTESDPRSKLLELLQKLDAEDLENLELCRHQEGPYHELIGHVWINKLVEDFDRYGFSQISLEKALQLAAIRKLYIGNAHSDKEVSIKKALAQYLVSQGRQVPLAIKNRVRNPGKMSSSLQSRLKPYFERLRAARAADKEALEKALKDRKEAQRSARKDNEEELSRSAEEPSVSRD